MVVSIITDSIISIIDTEKEVFDISWSKSGEILTSQKDFYIYKWTSDYDFKGALETSSCENLSICCQNLIFNKFELEFIISGGTRGIADVFLSNRVIGCLVPY